MLFSIKGWKTNDDLAFQAGFINIGMKGEFIAEADALDIYIVIHIADFLGQCHNAGGIMVDAVAQEQGEPRIYLTGGYHTAPPQ